MGVRAGWVAWSVALLVGGGCFVDLAPGSDGSGTASTSSGASEGSTSGESTGTSAVGTSSGGASVTSTTAETTSDATDPTTSTSGPSTTTGCAPKAWYQDLDGDGHGDPNAVMMACEAPTGHVPVGDDCDDSRKGVFPGATEICNQLDDDCDTFTDEFSPSNVECGGCSMSSIGGHIYHRCGDGRSWDEARAACKGRLADLLILETVAEESVLEQIAVLGNGAWWMGLSDQAEEGSFVWVDGSPPAESNWADGEPNDAGGAEDCGQVQVDGLWNDAECEVALPFVCEGEIVGK